MAGFLQKGLAGAGEAMERAGFAWMQKELDEAKQVRLEELRSANQAKRDDKLLAHQSAEGEKTRAHQSAEGEKTRSHAEGMQKTALEHAAAEHAKTREHQSTEAGLTRAHQSAEAEKGRALQRAGLGLQARQLAITEKGAELDQQIKKITLDNAKELEKLRSDYRTETDPAKRAAIADNIRILSGKDTDKFLPVPLKDDMGNVIGYEIFDKTRGVFVDRSGRGGAPSSGGKPGERPPLSQFLGGGKDDKPKTAERPAPPVVGARGTITRSIEGAGPVPGGAAHRIQNPDQYGPLEEDEEARYQN